MVVVVGGSWRKQLKGSEEGLREEGVKDRISVWEKCFAPIFFVSSN